MASFTACDDPDCKFFGQPHVHTTAEVDMTEVVGPRVSNSAEHG